MMRHYNLRPTRANLGHLLQEIPNLRSICANPWPFPVHFPSVPHLCPSVDTSPTHQICVKSVLIRGHSPAGFDLTQGCAGAEA